MTQKKAKEERAYKAELETIRGKHGGVLRSRDVVAFAKSPKTLLHSRFEWDNTKAGAEYRLWQARELIRVLVRIVPTSKIATRVYVSLAKDQHTPGGGYRTMDDVLASVSMREALLNEARADMERFKAKYHHLKELAGVFRAMDKVKAPKPRRRKPS